MTREDTVAVRLKPEIKGGVHYAAGQHRELHLEPGQVASTWANGAPILRAEFEASLEREGFFEIVPAPVEIGRGRAPQANPPRAEKGKEE